MFEVNGVSVSHGIGVGKVFFLPYYKRPMTEYSIDASDVISELQRLETSIASVDHELDQMYQSLKRGDANKKKTDLLVVHRLILKDPALRREVEELLHKELRNIESLLFRFAAGIEQKLNNTGNPMFADRGSDIQDVAQRLLDNLLGYHRDDSLSRINEDCIVITYDLSPSDAIILNPFYVKGLLTESGSTLSHAAIFARSIGIPAIMGIENLMDNYHQKIKLQIERKKNTEKSKAQLIIDGNQAKAIFFPTQEVLNKYMLAKKLDNVHLSKQLEMLQPIVESRDGCSVHLYTNVGSFAELKNDYLKKSRGVGLFRSEFLFLDRIPSEEEQFVAYCKILSETTASQEVTIRTIDLGGDKIPVRGLSVENNPFLGCRAIRLSIAHPEGLFIPQVRAIYRAAAYASDLGLASVRLMLPLIADQTELILVKQKIFAILESLLTSGLYIPQVPIGIMIELPSAALCSDILAREADFFSIGTNDLVQYTFGIDRVNETVAHLYDPLHLSVMKLIEMTLQSANRSGISVSLCGEMASDPYALPLLLGLGLSNFSMNPYSLPGISAKIQELHIEECKELAQAYMQQSDYQQANEILCRWYRKYQCEVSTPALDKYQKLHKMLFE